MKKIIFFFLLFCSGHFLSAQNPYPDTWTRMEAYYTEPNRAKKLVWTMQMDRKKRVLTMTDYGFSNSVSVSYFSMDSTWSARSEKRSGLLDSTWITTDKKKGRRDEYHYGNGELLRHSVSDLNSKDRITQTTDYTPDNRMYGKQLYTYLYDTLKISNTRYDIAGGRQQMQDSTVWKYNAMGLPEYELRYNSNRQLDTTLSTWYTYEDNGKIRKDKAFDHDHGHLIVFRDFTEKYNDKGQRVELIEAAEWFNIYARHVYEYDGDGNLLKETVYGKDGTVYSVYTHEYKYYE